MDGRTKKRLMLNMPALRYVSRINQIDAGLLDDEIYKVLRDHTKKLVHHFPPGKIDRFQPEIDAGLKFLIWYYSLRKGKSTFGQQLLNLNYTDIDKRKSLLYLIFMIVPKYALEKFVRNRFMQNSTYDKLKFYMERIANVVSMLQFINLILFLHRGTQPSLIECLLGIHSQSVTTHRPRNIGYSYMTRELLWHGLIELFTIGIPLINFHYLKQALTRLCIKKKKCDIVRTFPTMNVFTKCAYCKEKPILPTHAGCEHIFCYYCLKAHFMAMRMFHCPSCDMELYSDKMKHYSISN